MMDIDVGRHQIMHVIKKMNKICIANLSFLTLKACDNKQIVTFSSDYKRMLAGMERSQYYVLIVTFNKRSKSKFKHKFAHKSGKCLKIMNKRK